MSEWFMEPVLKTGDAARHRGFESLSLRQRKSHPCVGFALAESRTGIMEKYPSGYKGLPC